MKPMPGATTPQGAAGGAVETDALIVGAGPAGLFQAFELGLLDIRAHIVDALPHPGGQCVELYADKPIYDIPGVPVCSGRELVDNLLRQVQPFNPTFHLGHLVSTVQRQPDGRFLVETDRGARLLAKTLFIAGGAGAFLPRRLRVEGLDAFQGTQLFHRVDDPALFQGRDLVIVGGDDAALDCAVRFAAAGGTHRARSVLLVHRRDVFQAGPGRIAEVKALCDRQEMQFMAGQVTGLEKDETGRLAQVKVTGNDGVTRAVPLDMLLVLLGLSPKLGPIAEWGLELERKQLAVDTEKFQTSEPGIFAVGDVNTYPGKKKLILCGFHECTLAAFGAAAIVFPDQTIHLQYTTTSPKLHKALGVEVPDVD